MSIFVQIASYRDPQLVPTLRDCLKNADYPNKLVFCIAWQHSEDETLMEFRAHPQVKVIDIDYRNSKGVCWARHQIQQHYNGEDYTLQLDSHHRFVRGWDTKCLTMIKQLKRKGTVKPLLTGYLPSFDPDHDPASRVNKPWRMVYDHFTPDGTVLFLPETIDNYAKLCEPVRAHFYSGHFCFTLGQFCREVPHDPNYYFHGEEISISARAFTWGYDLFHPHQVIIWHEYTRQGRTKHWDDQVQWHELNTRCQQRNRCLFSMDGAKYESIDWGAYGFGKHRSLQEYEEYTGLDFKTRGLKSHTRSLGLTHHVTQRVTHRVTHRVLIPLSSVPHDDYDFWSISFEHDGVIIHRQDIDESTCRSLLSNVRSRSRSHNLNRPLFVEILCEFDCAQQPDKVVTRPHSRKHGCGDQVTFYFKNYK